MTGFGKAIEKCPYGRIIAEIKTLNHKSLSVTTSPFNGFFLLEERVKKVLEKKIFRGKVFVKITLETGKGRKPLQRVEINENIAREYLKKIEKTQQKLGIGGGIEIRDLIEFPGVIESSTESKEEKLWPYIKKALEKALNSIITYRKSEGLHLAKDLKTRLLTIKQNMGQIKKYGKAYIGEYRKKLVQSILELAENTEPDKGRIEAEVASFAKNCDIAEEITRLEGHLSECKEAMQEIGTDVGKKLDFIAQEMQREVNTIGAKSADFRIAKAVINIKSEIEKMREQIKNVE